MKLHVDCDGVEVNVRAVDLTHPGEGLRIMVHAEYETKALTGDHYWRVWFTEPSENGYSPPTIVVLFDRRVLADVVVGVWPR